MAADPSTFTPTLADLGSIMRARTRDEDGNELGTFTPETRPTDGEATLAIAQALALVAGRLGSVPESLATMAKSIVALRAAMLVETSYEPEETGTETAYASYRDQYRDALADYDAAVQRDVGQTPEGQPQGIASVGMTSLVRQYSDQLAAGS